MAKPEETIKTKATQALKALAGVLIGFSGLKTEYNDLAGRFSNHSAYLLFNEKLIRWITRTAKTISEEVSKQEAERFLASGNSEDTRQAMDGNLAYLLALTQELREHPEAVLPSPQPKVPGVKHSARPPNQTPQQSRIVFIVHGHDREAVLELKNLLKDEWALDSIILSEVPGQGLTLLELLEREVPKAGYAIVLLTPDDFIETDDEAYYQARPNVLLELGWFFGSHGRDQVCILKKEGTRLPSDLSGIRWIDYRKSVREAVLDLRAELEAAKLVQFGSIG